MDFSQESSESALKLQIKIPDYLWENQRIQDSKLRIAIPDLNKLLVIQYVLNLY